MDTLVDNDILYKAAAYCLLEELLGQYRSGTDKLGVLGAARFVVIKRLTRKPPRTTAIADVLQQFQTFLESCAVVEPTEEELAVAADFELAAQRAAVALDTGESQLCAILIARFLRLLLTGDKRAIVAISRLISISDRLSYVVGRVCCFEQIFLRCLTAGTLVRLRSAVCSEQDVDKALTICFSCSSPTSSLTTVEEGLASYINDLRNKAPGILEN